MKKTFLLIPILFIAFSSCKPPKNPTAKEIIIDVDHMYSNHKSVSFVVSYSITNSGKDPINNMVHCKLIRDPKDLLFNGIIWFNTSSGNDERYYNQGHLYVINNAEKKYSLYDDSKNASASLTADLASGAKNIYFLKPAELLAIASDSTASDSLSIDKIGYEDYWKVRVEYPNDRFTSERWTELWVNRKDTSIHRIQNHFKFMGQDETKEWNIDSLTFDKVNPENLKKQVDTKLSLYTVNQDSSLIGISTGQ